jgi:hypothetical protein
MANNYLFEGLSKTNVSEWDSFLLGQPYNNPFQSGKLFLCLKDTRDYEPKGIVVRRKGDNQIIGGFVLYKIVEKTGIISKFATRTILNGGPIVKKGYEYIISELSKKIIASYRKDFIYTEIWNMFPQDSVKEFFTEDFRYMPHLNYFVDLNCDIGTVYSRISKSTKKHIRKAEKNLKVEIVKDEAQFESFYDCLKERYKELSLPLISRDIFKKVYESKVGMFLLAYYKDIPVASRVVLPFGKEIYDWYAGDKYEFRDYYSGELLVWWILRYGVENKYKWFNFGGAGKPGVEYGPREFKRRFGGNLVEYGRYQYISSKLLYLIMQQGVKFLEYLKRH